MARDDGICGAIGTARAIHWPDDWYGSRIPGRRPVRTDAAGPQTDAVVGRRCIRVTSVHGWRIPDAESGAPGNGHGFVRRVPDPPPCVQREMAEEAERLRAALDILPGRYRQALVLVYVEGRTHGEAAVHLDVPLGTAKAWVRRGLRALREAHASFAQTPAPALATASRLRVALHLESRRASRVTLQVSSTPG